MLNLVPLYGVSRIADDYMKSETKEKKTKTYPVPPNADVTNPPIDKLFTRVWDHPFCKFARNLKELLVLLIFWIAWVAKPFGKPMLEVSYRIDRMYPPIISEKALNEQATEVNKQNRETNQFAKLVSSRDIMRLTIVNNSTKKIESLDLQIDGFTLADIALHSNSSEIMDDRERLAFFKISDNFVVKFPNFTSIPPRAKVMMILWGNFNTFLLRHPVKIFSTAESAEVYEQGLTTGIGLFIARNLRMLTILLAVGLLLWGLRRYKYKQPR